jgi:hypothetical protein
MAGRGVIEDSWGGDTAPGLLESYTRLLIDS